MVSTDISWLIGGPQGSGVESAANIFSKACASMGYHIFGKREFYSNIKGEHSYFTVRVSDSIIRSNVDNVTLMVAFDAETIFRHYSEIIQNGAIIYDSDLVQTSADEVHTIDAPYKSRLAKHLGPKPTIQNALDFAKNNGAKLYPISFKTILSNMADETNNPRIKGMARMYNVLGVSVSLGILKMPPKTLLDAIGSIFAKKQAIADLNKNAATYSYNYATAKFPDFAFTLNPTSKSQNTILVQGYQGTALGKMACGCRFQPYYPITPASDESVFLESNEIVNVKDDRPGSTIVVQTEDEISAIGMTIGGALTGTRSATCTSGPGFSLMAEALGWAGINEVPIVVTLYQRSGPSTGLPTRHGQDDLLFAIHAGHGEFPKIVYASGDVEESFYDTARCFNYSEQYQLPVIHMMDKFLASSVVTCKRFDVDKIKINRGKLLEKLEPGANYKRFAFTDDNLSPRSKLGLENGIFWNTGDESDEAGHITEDPEMRIKMMDKRQSKLDYVLKTIPDDEQAVSFGIEEISIISWGSPKGPILDAIDLLKKENIKIGFIQVKLLHPFPKDRLGYLFKNVKTIIDVESNHVGQLGELIKQNLQRTPNYYILKYTGRTMTSTEIYDSIKNIIANKAKARQVLTHGA
ncbi:MAG: 2-oxoacid:acceptor oxidoreductase subunit alpha [Nitrosopumilaceae archaeon]|nr:2-oxoacid:acceptor oxidoreductase subunit alpha [Nitrososphaeria archaeon]NDB50617.1 2-oxoacid:acceptor oxidoreductase subunit alpha [Nitrosopumilaceae archaeon]NDB87732.1 2-oxoacid:acceptor oxidoreductase subunit alpha [Nitrososphaerota archaeon]NDB91853.1 2-oxoacid:acceptor oxidoreductase subunit alpha [Nitrososphaeria archaeon]NDF25331.1 2-oxoacid:acceptor oxidoreductase subunit alpha [Nitrososphaerota archaeon]